MVLAIFLSWASRGQAAKWAAVVLIGTFLALGHLAREPRDAVRSVEIQCADCRADSNENLTHLTLPPATLGEVLVRRVELANGGPSDCVIPDVRTSCDCVRVSPTKLTLLPGESRSLEVTVDLRDADVRPGKLGAIITLLPERSKPIELNVHLDIRPTSTNVHAAVASDFDSAEG